MPKAIALSAGLSLLALTLFHQQAELPTFWFWISSHLSTASGTLAFVACITASAAGIFALVKQPHPLSILLGLTLLLTLLMLRTGLEAAQRLSQQVPLDCHRSLHRVDFLIEDIAFLPEGTRRWTIQVLDAQAVDRPHTATPCLQVGGRLNLMAPGVAEESNHLLPTAEPGQAHHALLQIKPNKAPLQLQGFDVQAYWFAQNIAGQASLKSTMTALQAPTRRSVLTNLERLRFHIGEEIVRALEGHRQQGLVLALVTGDQGLISPEDRDLFSNTGIAHLVAISGLHITLFAWLLSLLTSRLWALSPRCIAVCPSPLAGSVAGLVLATVYALLAGWGVPAQRTLLMQAGFLLARSYPGRSSLWSVYWAVMLLSCLSNPWVLMDTGFYLSFGAVGLLIFSNQGLRQHHSPPGGRITQMKNLLNPALRAQYTATVGLIPLSAALFFQQSLISPLCNALSIPWMSFVSTPLCLLAALTGNDWLIYVAAESLQVQQIWLDAALQIPWASANLPLQTPWLYALSFMGVLLLLLPQGIAPRWLGWLALSSLLWPPTRPPEGVAWVDVLDVGQGTTVAIRTRQHTLMYDTGPAFNARSDSARRVIWPWMQSQGIVKLDQLWLSHDDADHTGGAPFLIPKARPSTLINHLATSHPLNQLATAQGAQIRDCKSLPAWDWDGVSFTPISPPKAVTPDPLAQDNNQSCLLKVQAGPHSLLLTGDIERAAEEALLRQIQRGEVPAHRLQASVLYAPHYGSKTSSTPAFIQAVGAKFILIQSGWGNAYGHPNPAVTARYLASGAQLEQTAQNGALHLSLAPESPEISIENALEKRLRYWHLHERGALVQ